MKQTRKRGNLYTKIKSRQHDEKVSYFFSRIDEDGGSEREKYFVNDTKRKTF